MPHNLKNRRSNRLFFLLNPLILLPTAANFLPSALCNPSIYTPIYSPIYSLIKEIADNASYFAYYLSKKIGCDLP